jgi:heat shock protein HslJ
MDQEMAFMQALQDAANFETGEGSLRLLSADSTLLAELASPGDN